MKIFKKVTKYLGIIFVIILITYTSMVVFLGETVELPFELTRVVSGSMEPSIKTGAMVLVTPVDDISNISVGDVVIFTGSEIYGPETRVIHRVVEIQGTSVLTKGDHNSVCDTWLDFSNIQAKAVIIFNIFSKLYFTKNWAFTNSPAFRNLIKCFYSLFIATALYIDLQQHVMRKAAMKGDDT